MQNITKRLLSLAIAAVMVLSMVPATALQARAEDGDTAISIYYDDRLAISELGGNDASTVEITAQSVTSKQVGTSTADSAVVVYESGRLIAVGTGTATVTVDGVAHEIVVEAAPISLVMLTGHSIGAGQAGTAGASVLCEDGQAYSTHAVGRTVPTYITAGADGVGIGYSSASKPTGIDAFVSTGSGTVGEASGIAYRWNQLTGEKIWVLNAALGGSALTTWVKGGAQYNNAVSVFKYAQNVLKNEVAAGHYSLKDMAIIYHSAANWGYVDNYFNNDSWSDATGKVRYDSMIDGFKSDLAMDITGDGVTETVGAIGMVPIWTTGSVSKYNNDIPANFFMAVSDSYPEVFMASLTPRPWIRDISTFPAINYNTHGTAVSAPAAAADLFTDGVHLSQAAYNAAGMDTADNLYAKLRTDVKATAVTFKTPAGGAVSAENTLYAGESLKLVPEVTHMTASDLTFTVSDNLSLAYPCTVEAVSGGEGTLTVSQGDTVLSTIQFTVEADDTTDPSDPEPSEPKEPENPGMHCICGGDVRGEAHAYDCYLVEDSVWVEWTSTTSLPRKAGYYKLTADVNVAGQTDFGSGLVVLDLNGHTVTQTKAETRIYYIYTTARLTITDTSAEGDGKLVSCADYDFEGDARGAIVRADNDSVVNIYGGTLDASGTTAGTRGAAIDANNKATVNIYGGTVKGGTAPKGGAVYLSGNSSMTVSGGTILGGTAPQGGAVFVESGATLAVTESGRIVDGTADQGDAVYVNGGKFTVSGSARVGEVYSGGAALRYGCLCGDPNGAGTACAEDGHKSITWQPWSTTGSLPSSGNYYLTVDVNITAQKNLENTLALDLNGHTIKQTAAEEEARVFYAYVSAQLTITDTSENGNGRIVPGARYVDKGDGKGAIIKVDGTASLTIYGGTLDASGTTATTGGAVYMNAGTTFNMYGGTIIGGTATNGGAVYVSSNATFNMKGGTIRDGKTVGGDGGNIYVTAGTVNITGGTIKDGDANPVAGATTAGQLDKRGGNISMWSGSTVIVGGTAKITGGNADRGGNIYGHKSTFVVRGQAQITGGTADKKAYGSGGDCVNMDAEMTVKLGGKPVISQMYMNATDTVITNLGLESGVSIKFRRGVSKLIEGAVSADVAAGLSITGSVKLSFEADGVYVRATSDHVSCLCGKDENGKHFGNCDGYDFVWTAHTGSGLPKSGYYYLTADVSTNQLWYQPSNGYDLKLDLNGHTVTMNSNIYMYNGGKLTITDSVGTGKLVTTADHSGVTNSSGTVTGVPGGIIRVDTNAVLELYNVTLDASAGKNINGGALYVTNNGVANMYGGTIIGGTATKGGAVYLNATSSVFNMYSGAIEGGNTGSEGYGGAIYINAGTFHMKGGKVSGGYAKFGGSILLANNANAKFVMDGGTIEGGTAEYGGGAVCVIGGGATFTMNDGLIDGGTVTINSGGSIQLNGGSAYFVMNGGTISGGTAKNAGGTVHIQNATAKFTMNGGTINGGKTTNAGYGGGGAFAVTGILELNGGTVNGGTAGFNGGVIFMDAAGAVTTLNGGTVQGGTAKAGGTVYIGKGTLNIQKGTITGGTATQSGNCVYVADAGCKVKLSGTPKIDEITLAKTLLIDVTDLEKDADIGISAPEGVFTNAAKNADVANAFTSTKANTVVVANEDLTLQIVAVGNFVEVGNSASVEAAVRTVAGTNSYIRLTGDITGDISVSKTVYLDLNGKTISGNVTVADGAVLKVFDSATKTFETPDSYGMITGTVTGNLARTMNTPKATYGNNYKYLTIKEAGGYSFHRIYLSVKSVVLNPYVTDAEHIGTAVNYRTVFKCNDIVKRYVTAYGAKLSGEETVYVDYLENDAVLDGDNLRTTALTGTIKSSNTAEQNTANAALTPDVCAYITLSDGLGEVTSAQVSRSLKDMVSYANASMELDDLQKTALGKMYGQFRDSMDNWGIYLGNIKIYHAEKVLGQPIVKDKTVAITFDDGPNVNNSMSDVLDILGMYDVKATFFLIGKAINDNTAPVVKRAYDEGHELGGHGYSHVSMNAMTAEEVIAEYTQTADAIQAITGEAPRFFRPPFLSVSDVMRQNIPAPFISKNTDGGDWNSGSTAESVAAGVLAGAKDGGIILLHVSSGYDWTEQALHIIIPELWSMGYDITTVGGLFEAKGVEPQNGVTYSQVN